MKTLHKLPLVAGIMIFFTYIVLTIVGCGRQSPDVLVGCYGTQDGAVVMKIEKKEGQYWQLLEGEKSWSPFQEMRAPTPEELSSWMGSGISGVLASLTGVKKQTVLLRVKPGTVIRGKVVSGEYVELIVGLALLPLKKVECAE